MGAAQKSTHLRVRRLPPADLGDGRRTILHASKLPLTVWFWAAYLMATHSNGISALQLQKQLGIGSYRSAWPARPQAARQHGRPRAQPVVGPGGNRRGQPSIPDQRRSSHRRARTQPRRQDAHESAPSNSGTETSQAACGWPKSPPTAPPTSDTSSKPPPIPTPSRKPTLLGSGYAAVPADRHNVRRREDRRSPRPAVDPPSLLQPQRMGARRLPGTCVASSCRPIS